jgi:hypothetical protein
VAGSVNVGALAPNGNVNGMIDLLVFVWVRQYPTRPTPVTTE